LLGSPQRRIFARFGPLATKNVYRIVDSGSKGPESCENPPLWAAEQTVA